MSSPTPVWQQLATAKREAVEALIPAEWRIQSLPSPEEQRDVSSTYLHQFLTRDEIEITETDAPGIAARTTTGEWTAVEVVKAFCHRAALVHQVTNSLLEIFFDLALSRAAELDNYFKTHNKPVGPLHGVPISLKDQFHVKGVETTMGYVGWIGTFQGAKDHPNYRTFESELVRELQSLGAVPFCKTSVPHTLMSGESNNNIMGYVWNPKNRNLSAGGSSGGEGALIGARGSPLGFGTDIGGSVRIPSAFNGLYGLRPSSGRLPYQGMANSMDGQNTVLSVVGPLATTARSLKFIMQNVLSTQPWLHDPLVTELPWRVDQEQEMRTLTQPGNTLAFGLLEHDGIADLHPPVKRAIQTVARALQNHGHEVHRWAPPQPASHNTVMAVGNKTWGYDGGADVHSAFALSGEPPVKQIAAVYGTQPGQEVDASYIHQTNREKRDAQKAYMDYWNSTAALTSTGRPVDALIAPVAPFAAARPETYHYVGYTMFVNVLDYTSVVVPVTTVDKNVDRKAEGYTPKDSLNEMLHGVYDPEVYDGAHVAVQIILRRFQEEKACVLAEYLSEVLEKEREVSKG